MVRFIEPESMAKPQIRSIGAFIALVKQQDARLQCKVQCKAKSISDRSIKANGQQVVRLLDCCHCRKHLGFKKHAPIPQLLSLVFAPIASSTPISIFK